MLRLSSSQTGHPNFVRFDVLDHWLNFTNVAAQVLIRIPKLGAVLLFLLIGRHTRFPSNEVQIRILFNQLVSQCQRLLEEEIRIDARDRQRLQRCCFDRLGAHVDQGTAFHPERGCQDQRNVRKILQSPLHQLEG